MNIAPIILENQIEDRIEIMESACFSGAISPAHSSRGIAVSL
jgi:hypothetical protein